MKAIRNIAAVLVAALLAVTLVGAGFVMCTAPPVTRVLANAFSDDATSPFSRSQLVEVAEATRDYSFGAHDLGALYASIYDVDRQLANGIERTGGSLPAGFPDLSRVSGPEDAAGLALAFANASELYCFSPETIAHLDDCHSIARAAYPLLAIAAIAATAGLIALGVVGGRRMVARVLIAAGIVALAAFVGLGAWAAIDFDGLFATLHRVFFSQGNWTFPYDSLLICALPAAFWMGMGAVWLATTVILAATSALIGRRAHDIR